MKLTPRLDAAIKLALHLHRNQTRKDYNFTPYASHLIAVSILLSEVTEDEDIIIAGLMHDSLEDIPNYTFENLVEDCGERVAHIVKHVSEPLDGNKPMNDQLPWLVRKETYLNNLKEGGMESALVSASDKIHNTESFLHDAKKDGDVFLKRFSSSAKNKIWFNQEVLLIVSEKLGQDHLLVKRLHIATKELNTFLIAYE